jgi:hypothetical protein
MNVVSLTPTNNKTTLIDRITTTRTNTDSSSNINSNNIETVVNIVTPNTKDRLQWSLVILTYRYVITVVNRAT